MKFQKQVYNKRVQSWKHTLDEKVWLTSKYINTRWNHKFFGLFHVLYLVEKQCYKIELTKKYEIYDDFYILLLEQNIIKKKKVNKFHDPRSEYNNLRICHNL